MNKIQLNSNAKSNNEIMISLADYKKSSANIELTYTCFSAGFHSYGSQNKSTFDELEQLCKRPLVNAKKSALAFCPTIFLGNYRNAENAISASFLAFDLDDVPENITAEDILACISRYRAFCYSTFSHKMAGKGGRFRVVMALNNPIPANQYAVLAKAISESFIKLGGKVDKSCFSPAQYMYFPTVHPEREDWFEFQTQDGEVLDGLVVLENIAKEQSLIQEGSRNESLFKMGAQLQGMGMDSEVVRQILSNTNLTKCSPPLPSDEIDEITASVMKYAANPQNLTELVLAQETVANYQDSIRWVTGMGHWIKLNPESKLWERVESSAVIHLLTEQLQHRRRLESELIKKTGTDRYKHLRNIEKAERSGFLSGAESLMRSIPSIAISPQELDSNPYLVGLENGQCLDLQNGNVRVIKPTDYLTKHMSASYEPMAKCPIWESCIAEWTCNDVELGDFLQEWSGFCMSGLTNFQGFLFLYGGGCNGKSVFTSILASMMNDYSKSMDSRSLIQKPNYTGANSDIARLVGARLVLSQETQDGKCFDENLLKQLTGGDMVTARHLYQSEFDYKPSLKLMISGNNLPIVKERGEGFWRRVNIVPFNAKIEHPDPNLTEKLMMERSGILNWMIEGWRRYQSYGLKSPYVVKETSKQYRADSDILQHFIDDVLVMRSGASLPYKGLYQLYKVWCEQNGLYPMSKSQLSRKMHALIGKPIRRNVGMVYENWTIR